MARTLLPSRCMNVSLYQAAAAMNAHSHWQEVIAENLAACSTPGARKREVSFSAVEAGLAPTPAGSPQKHYVMPGSSVGINCRQGILRPTGQPTDLAIDGPGFLKIQLPDGTQAYTRDGELHLDAQGQLITKQGYPVLGDRGPLQLDPSNHAPISVSPTGEISQGGEVKGRIEVTEFNQPSLLTALNASYFVANNPNLQAGAARASQVRQGFVEEANTSPITEMASLVTAMGLFQANQRVLQAQDERMGRVISELGNPA